MDNVSFTSGHIFSCRVGKATNFAEHSKIAKGLLKNFSLNVKNTQRISVANDFLEINDPNYKAEVYNVIKDKGFFRKTKQNILTMIALYNQKKNTVSIFTATFDEYDNKIKFLQDTIKSHSLPREILFDSDLAIESFEIKSRLYGKINDEKSFSHLVNKMINIAKSNII